MKLPRRRELVALLLYFTGLVHLVGLARRLLGVGGPIFLTGHRVLPVAAGDADRVDRMALLSRHAITPEELGWRLRFLIRWVMPAGEPRDLAAGVPQGRRFYLTFDDGYRDNVEHAAPVLTRLGVQAVVFVVQDLVERPTAQPWWDRWGAEALSSKSSVDAAVSDYNLRCAKRKATCTGLDAADLSPGLVRRYLDAEELTGLGAPFYVGNHSRSHANLTQLDKTAVWRQVDEGNGLIAGHDRRLPLFAYPFGQCNADVVAVLREVPGYALALATGCGIEGDRLQQRRVNLNTSPFALFAAQAVGLL